MDSTTLPGIRPLGVIQLLFQKLFFFFPSENLSEAERLTRKLFLIFNNLFTLIIVGKIKIFTGKIIRLP